MSLEVFLLLCIRVKQSVSIGDISLGLSEKEKRCLCLSTYSQS